MKSRLKKTLALIAILQFFIFLDANAQMAAARSDAYQGNYSIKTGYGPSYGLLYNTDGTTYTGSEDSYFIRPSIHFALYNGMKLQTTNPTGSTTATTNNTVKTLKNTNTVYPFFNSQGADVNGNNIYNWASWMYPFVYNGIYPYVGTAANRDNALSYNPWEAAAAGKRSYQDYNDYYYNSGNSTRFNLSTDDSKPTNIYTRINQERDKIIISLWVGYLALDQQRQNAMMDLRVSTLDQQTKLYSRTWFNIPSNADEPAGPIILGTQYPSNEYNKIRAANTTWSTKNALNSGKGDVITNYNANMDATLYLPAGNYGVSGTTEGASEITGIRTIAYDNDPDPCGQMEKNVDANFRATTVGGTGGTEGATTTAKFYHPGDPYQLSYKHFLQIHNTRPVIAFPGVACGTLGPEITMVGATTGNIIPVTLDIKEATGALLPGTETTTLTAVTTDATRVRVSLVKKSVYDAAVVDGTIATNNDLATVSGFAYLTQDNFIALENTIPTGEYVLKYDYSAPDSKIDIKTEGDKLGEVFAKSIYRPLTVTSGLPVTFGSIEAKISAGQLLINWNTVKETNNNHFEIEASKDGINFIKIGEVKSKADSGNSNQNLSYSFTKDQNSAMALLGVSIFSLAFAALLINRKNKILFTLLLIGSVSLFGISCKKQNAEVSIDKNIKLWIRIKQVDKDGGFEYSKAIQAFRE